MVFRKGKGKKKRLGFERHMSNEALEVNKRVAISGKKEVTFSVDEVSADGTVGKRMDYTRSKRRIKPKHSQNQKVLAKRKIKSQRLSSGTNEAEEVKSILKSTSAYSSQMYTSEGELYEIPDNMIDVSCLRGNSTTSKKDPKPARPRTPVHTDRKSLIRPRTAQVEEPTVASAPRYPAPIESADRSEATAGLVLKTGKAISLSELEEIKKMILLPQSVVPQPAATATTSVNGRTTPQRQRPSSSLAVRINESIRDLENRLSLTSSSERRSRSAGRATRRASQDHVIRVCPNCQSANCSLGLKECLRGSILGTASPLELKHRSTDRRPSSRQRSGKRSSSLTRLEQPVPIRPTPRRQVSKGSIYSADTEVASNTRKQRRSKRQSQPVYTPPVQGNLPKPLARRPHGASLVEQHQRLAENHTSWHREVPKSVETKKSDSSTAEETEASSTSSIQTPLDPSVATDRVRPQSPVRFRRPSGRGSQTESRILCEGDW